MVESKYITATDGRLKRALTNMVSNSSSNTIRTVVSEEIEKNKILKGTVIKYYPYTDRVLVRLNSSGEEVIMSNKYNKKIERILSKYETPQGNNKYVKGEFVSKSEAKHRKALQRFMDYERVASEFLQELDYLNTTSKREIKNILKYYDLKSFSKKYNHRQILCSLYFCIFLNNKGFVKDLNKFKLWKREKLNYNIFLEVFLNYNKVIKGTLEKKDKLGTYKHLDDVDSVELLKKANNDSIYMSSLGGWYYKDLSES